jgi:hypothetical protein
MIFPERTKREGSVPMRSACRQVIAMAGLLAVPVFLGACSSPLPPVTANGTLTVEVNPLGGISLTDAYPDITDGSQVTVTDPSGKVIGTGTLSYSQVRTDVEALILGKAMGLGAEADLMEADIAVYTFTVTGLPGGETRYGFSVGTNRGTIWESPQQVKDPALSLGSLSS